VGGHGLGRERDPRLARANIAEPEAALAFRELGIGPQQVAASGLGEVVSIGRLSVDDAARTILGPRAAGGLDQLRAAFRNPDGEGSDEATRRRAGQAWWRGGSNASSEC
jgi:hypothetical protein